MTQRASGHPRTTDLAGELEHGLSLRVVVHGPGYR